MTDRVYRPYIWTSQVYDAEFVVEFPKSPNLELMCVGASLKQVAEGHDILLLRFKGNFFKKETQIAYKDPVTFTYKSGKSKSKFVGTVNRVKQTGTLKGVQETFVECVSASAVLKETSQKIYTNVTADQVVTKIAASVGMRAVCQRDPRLQSTIAHTGQTYWQFLRHLAKITGFALRAENTTLVFCSKDKITSSKKAGCPYFLYVDTKDKSPLSPMIRAMGSVISYRPITSDASPELGSMVDRVITGQNKTSGKAVKATHAKSTKKASTKTKVKKAQAASKKSAVKPSKDYFL